MDTNNNPITIVGWTEQECKLLAEIEANGIRPISATLATQLFNLFKEGYNCADIAKQNKGLSEGDILYCRKKFDWDNKRDKYLFELQVQAQGKLMRQKFESMIHLTDMLSVIHKEQKDQVMKFLQTGDTEDFPKFQSIKFYKDIIETLSKVTGEDRIQKHKIEGHIQQDTTIRNVGEPTSKISNELQAKLLRAMANSVKIDNKDG
jgi:hypothetical protein